VTTQADLTRAWLDSQPWPEAVKADAHAILAYRREQGLYPLTGGAWGAFARENGVTIVWSWQR
jgi:hypothetical protein